MYENYGTQHTIRRYHHTVTSISNHQCQKLWVTLTTSKTTQEQVHIYPGVAAQIH